MNNKVCVLMSTYNGEKYVKRQIETLLYQKEVDISIVIRDDGSSDSTVDVIKKIESPRITIIEGENLGFAQSFWNILKIVDGYDYYAFCDQDDIWCNNKLIEAIKKIRDYNMPALYTSDVIAVDSKENIIKKNAFGVQGVINYKESLIKSILPGCTFVFNKQLKKELCKYDGYLISHDWITYAIANLLGIVIFDRNSYIYYRIHDNNTIGINNKMTTFKRKIKRFFCSDMRNTRSKVVMNIYRIYGEKLDLEEQKICYLLGNCSKKYKYTIQLLKYKEYRNIDFLLMLFLRRI